MIVPIDVIRIIGITAFSAAAYGVAQYADLGVLEFNSKSSGWGRQKNATTVMVAGELASQIYPEGSRIRFDVKRTAWFDAEVTGGATPAVIYTRLSTMAATTEFEARADAKGLVHGEVRKSEFDWDANEISDGLYHIGRAPLKWDQALVLTAYNGTIEGKLVRKWFDWNISGRYDRNGNVECKIDVPLGLDINLEGRIVPLHPAPKYSLESEPE